MILFAFIIFLEDSGYMARAAFLMDRVMRASGLSGTVFYSDVIEFRLRCAGHHGHARHTQPTRPARNNAGRPLHDLLCPPPGLRALDCRVRARPDLGRLPEFAGPGAFRPVHARYLRRDFYRADHETLRAARPDPYVSDRDSALPAAEPEIDGNSTARPRANIS